MMGANEYCEAFEETQQVGKLYFVVAKHARGPTFHIYVLPEGEEAISNGPSNGPLNKDCVEVYGVVSGNPGWTESYGWLHRGPWMGDFESILKAKRKERDTVMNARKIFNDEAERTHHKHIAHLLANY